MACRLSSFLVCVVLAAPAAAKSDRDLILLAVPHDDVDRGVYRAIEAKLVDRGTVENASLQYRELHDPAPLPRGHLDHPPPAWWPEPLRWDWESGAAACRTRAEPPYGPGNKEAFVCGGRLAEALWQRYLEHQKPDLVVEVLMEPLHAHDELDDRQRLRVSAFLPGDPVQRRVERREVEWDQVREVASVLALRVATGGGSRAPRAIVRALPTPKPKADVPIPELAGLAVPSRCLVPLSAALEIEPKDARLAQILVRQWANTVASARKRGPPLSCELDTEARPQQLMGQTVLLGSAILTCDRKAKVVAKLHKTTEAVLETAMSAELTRKLVDAHCKGFVANAR